MERRTLVVGLAALAVTGALALGAVAVLRPAGPAEPPTPTGSAAIGMPADAALVDQTGKPFTAADLKGKPTAVFFGFTYCPEICPTTLMDVGRWMEALGPDADKLRVVFISIDPERDTPQQLTSYLSSFDKRIRGVTGAPQAVDHVAQGFRVYYRKVPTEGGDYTMDHSTIVYLMDGDGRFVEPVGYQEPIERVLPKLKRLIGG